MATPESTEPLTYTTDTATELVDEANNSITVNALQDNAPVTGILREAPQRGRRNQGDRSKDHCRAQLSPAQRFLARGGVRTKQDLRPLRGCF